MKQKAFHLLHGMESSWWYQGRKRVAAKVLSAFIPEAFHGRVLDFGSGYGGMFDLLSSYGTVDGFELDENARKESLERGYRKVFSSSDEAFSSGEPVSLVALFDVVEHVEDDHGLAETLYRHVCPGGYVVITVPAFQRLWSVHDVEHNHFRRYTKKHIVRLLADSGFTVRYASYWNMILFVPAAAVRLLGSSGSASFQAPRLVDRLLYGLVFLESLFMPFLSLPWGTGIVVLAQRVY